MTRYSPKNSRQASGLPAKNFYKESLLEHARTQWKLGDWQVLVLLDNDLLQGHADRAEIALLAAAGRLQIGDTKNARRLIQCSKQWGCRKELIFQILVAGTHNSLGLVSTIINQQHRAIKHFKNSVTLTKSCALSQSMLNARIRTQLISLGLPEHIAQYELFIQEHNSEPRSPLKTDGFSSQKSLLKTETTNRWTDPKKFPTLWDERTKLIAKLIPDGTRVIEFGAANMKLKAMLPDSCVYTPCDLYDRGEGTIIFDLNSLPFPEIGGHDIAIFGGVLEYVVDISSILKYLKSRVKTIIASYAVLDLNKTNRTDWTNHYNFEEIVNLFSNSGFKCSNISLWRKQLIFIFNGNKF